ncbi:MAG: DUF4190 domain-containing protein [Bifidobacteriaceae bacterium]|nr:DUF4190 domain-containing protein [Bifidobacteriaceae bacterium]
MKLSNYTGSSLQGQRIRRGNQRAGKKNKYDLFAALAVPAGIFLGPVGLVLGIIGLRRIAKGRRVGMEVPGRGAAITGIVIGALWTLYIVAGIIFVIWLYANPVEAQQLMDGLAGK